MDTKKNASKGNKNAVRKSAIRRKRLKSFMPGVSYKPLVSDPFNTGL